MINRSYDVLTFYHKLSNKPLKELQTLLKNKYYVFSNLEHLGYFGYGLSVDKEEKYSVMAYAEELLKNNDKGIHWISNNEYIGYTPLKIGYTPIISIDYDTFYTTPDLDKKKEELLNTYIKELVDYCNIQDSYYYNNYIYKIITILAKKPLLQRDELIQKVKEFNDSCGFLPFDIYYSTYDNQLDENIFLRKLKNRD